MIRTQRLLDHIDVDGTEPNNGDTLVYETANRRWTTDVGTPGPTGPAGADGADGNTILYGSSDPTTEGNDGDFYINTTSNYIFGPKSGTWPSGTSLVGPTGPAGADGNTILYGASDPTTEGVDGDFYINTTSNTLFGPKSGTWPAGTSLIGPAGSDGADGADGADGNTVLYGSSDPTTEGVDGDFYINTTSNYIFGPKSGTWPSGTSLVGPTGATGPAGSDGADGNTVLYGSSDPTTEGVDGDFYINTTSNTIFGPKSGTWPAGTSLVGPTGATGATGPQGDPGADGADGNTVLYGSSDPTTEGVDGDFYINTTSNYIFGPKSGTWPSGTSLVGPTGATGAQGDPGTDGNTVLYGSSDPTTEGVDGDFYINTTSNYIFGPKSGTWPSGTSLVGPTGATGAAGADGSDGADGKTVLNGTVNPTTEGVDGDFYINTTTDTIFGPKSGGSWGSGTSLIGPTGVSTDSNNQASLGTDSLLYVDAEFEHTETAGTESNVELIASISTGEEAGIRSLVNTSSVPVTRLYATIVRLLGATDFEFYDTSETTLSAEFADAASALTIAKYNTSGNAFIVIDPICSSTGRSLYRIFRNVNTSDECSVIVYKGNDTTNAGAQINGSGTEDSFLCNQGGNLGIGTISPTQQLDIAGSSMRLRNSNTPASASDTGDQGEICWDSSYLYICTATDTWKRVAISTW